MSLPAPSPDALAASQALQQQIAADIERQGGAIPFSRFMEQALYAPGLGYYSGGSAKLGKDGDFTTAPELTALFGQAVAHAAAAIMAQSAPHILEFGAGTGKLAFDVLTELAQAGVTVESYAIVDLSGELRARQQQRLKDFPQVRWLEILQPLLQDFPQVRWLDRLPARFEGVVLGNEEIGRAHV